MPSTIYTLGYQGLSLEAYIGILKEYPVSKVLDVRAAAWSRKPGFTKSTMQQGLHDAGLGYRHLESAGNPFRKEESENILEKYRDYLQKHSDPLEAIEAEIAMAAKEQRSVCMTCFEKDPAHCHRSIIVEFLLERNPRLHVVHLGNEDDQLSLI